MEKYCFVVRFGKFFVILLFLICYWDIMLLFIFLFIIGEELNGLLVNVIFILKFVVLFEIISN